MEKVIFKKIVLIFTAIFVSIFLTIVTTIFIIRNKSAINDLSQMISQIEDAYNESKTNFKITEDLFKEDYLNRAYAIDYMLSNNPEKNLNVEALENIKELMEIESIHCIDSNGIIVLSNDSNSIGLNLLSSPKAHSFWRLIENDNMEDYAMDLDAISIIGNEDKIYIAIKSTLKDYSAIQIEINRDVLGNRIKKDTIEYIVRNIPTIYEKAIFLVNKNTGVLESITVNNEQGVVFDNIDNSKEYIDKLYDSTNGKLVKINGKYRYMKTKIVDDYIIGAYVDLGYAYNGVSLEITYLTLGILIAFLVITLIFKFTMKKYILTDIFSIGKNIRKLITGNYEIEFDVKYDTELKEIAYMLNDLKDSYKYKSERMSRIMSTINFHIGVFECLYLINRNFFSDNIQEILGLDDDKWKEVSSEPKKFQEYIESIENKGDIININNKSLNIVSFKRENEFYGMIIDKTKDEETKRRIEKISETDGLTKLLNRRGLENRLKEVFKKNNNKGVLMIFDLDNFKLINDDLGHPVGDEVLKIFASCLNNSFRENDVISRIGGDEFIVFINKNISIEGLSNKLNNILKYIRYELSYYYENYGLSTSIGVSYKNSEINTYDELYKEADKGLYKAKELGKDRFYVSNKDN